MTTQSIEPIDPGVIRPLPVTPPSLSDPANFDARGDAVIGHIPVLIDDMNSVAAKTKQNADAAHERAQIAEAAKSAVAASASAASSAAARAESARDLAVQAEAAIEQALAEGPVLSVQGKTGIVDITEELHAAALYF